ncbi:hypothetical protein OOJ09_29220 [Mesorhizobium qingshengii]|uniref:Uncharacterized protein n=1 Tax=Mesorhizobium qingshengii TaxID=1165689 RepID=A0ABT4R362_9HYPH|nr:hypothetical protein [Mesorhizobium qingshengii]MCZ8548273.1 hypothetical protein [Mesorhizobium qingshengii]
MLVIVFLLFQIVLKQRALLQLVISASDLSENRCAPFDPMLMSGKIERGHRP